MPDVNPEPCAIDEQVDRSIRGDPAELDLSKFAKPPGQGRVIRDREIQLEQLSQRPEEALGLAKRKMKDHADRQRSLYREVGIGALATRPPASTCSYRKFSLLLAYPSLHALP